MKPDEKPVAPEAGCNQMEREVAEQQPLLENNTPAQPGTAAHADNGWRSREADNSMAPFEAETLHDMQIALARLRAERDHSEERARRAEDQMRRVTTEAEQTNTPQSAPRAAQQMNTPSATPIMGEQITTLLTNMHASTTSLISKMDEGLMRDKERAYELAAMERERATRQRSRAERRTELKTACKPVTEAELSPIKTPIDLAMLKTKFTPAFDSFLVNRNKKAYEVLHMSEAEYADMLDGDPEEREEATMLSDFLAQTIVMCITNDTCKAKAEAWRKRLNAAPIEKRTNGRYVYAQLFVPVVTLSDTEAEAARDKFNAKVKAWLTPGMDSIAAKGKIDDMLAEYRELPEDVKPGKHAELTMLIDMMKTVDPEHATKLKGKKVEDELTTGRLRESLSIDRIKSKIVATVATKAITNISYAEAARKATEETELNALVQRRVEEQRRAEDQRRGGLHNNNKDKKKNDDKPPWCVNCGGEHYVADCDLKSHCKTKGCPCVWIKVDADGKPCVPRQPQGAKFCIVTGNTEPKMGELKSRVGKPMPDWLQTKIIKAYKKFHGIEIAMMEASNVGGEHNEEEGVICSVCTPVYEIQMLEMEEDVADSQQVDETQSADLEDMLENVPEEELQLYFDQLPQMVLGPATWVQQHSMEDTPEAAGIIPAGWSSSNMTVLLTTVGTQDTTVRRITFSPTTTDPSKMSEEVKPTGDDTSTDVEEREHADQHPTLNEIMMFEVAYPKVEDLPPSPPPSPTPQPPTAEAALEMLDKIDDELYVATCKMRCDQDVMGAYTGAAEAKQKCDDMIDNGIEVPLRGTEHDAIVGPDPSLPRINIVKSTKVQCEMAMAKALDRLAELFYQEGENYNTMDADDLEEQLDEHDAYLRDARRNRKAVINVHFGERNRDAYRAQHPLSTATLEILTPRGGERVESWSRHSMKREGSILIELRRVPPVRDRLLPLFDRVGGSESREGECSPTESTHEHNHARVQIEQLKHNDDVGKNLLIAMMGCNMHDTSARIVTASSVPRSIEAYTTEFNLLIERQLGGELNVMHYLTNYKFLIDSGANAHLVKEKDIFENAEVRNELAGPITGWNGQASGRALNVCVFDAHFQAMKSTVPLDAIYSPSATRNILSESAITDKYNAVARKELDSQWPMTLTWGTPPYAFTPIERENGLYFATFAVSRRLNISLLERAKAMQEINAADLNKPYGTRVNGDDRIRLWSSRLVANERTMRLLSVSTRGTGIESLTKKQIGLVTDDTVNRRSRMRRTQAVARTRDVGDAPGHMMHIDAFGPVAAQSIVDRSLHHLIAVCAVTDFTIDDTTTGLNSQRWIEFVEHVVLVASAAGHTIKNIRFDGDPAISTPSFNHGIVEKAVNKMGITVEFAAGTNHEGNARAEAKQDKLERMAEAMLNRPRPALGRAFLMAARRYSVYLLNRLCIRGDVNARIVNWDPKMDIVDFADVPPLIFMTTVAYVAAEEARGSKGDLDTRSPLASFVGIYKDKSYLLITQTGQIVSRAPRNVVALDELELSRNGMPAVVRAIKDGEHVKEHIEKPGDSVEDSEIERAEWLSSQKEKAAAELSRLKSKSDSNEKGTCFPDVTRYEEFAPLDERGPPSTRTRARQAAQAVISVLDTTLSIDMDVDEANDKIAAVAYSMYGEASEDIMHMLESNVSGAVVKMIHMCAMNEDETQGGCVLPIEIMTLARPVKTAHVKTKLGVAKAITIPSSTKQVLADQHYEKWLEADRKAVGVQLAVDNNYMAPADEVVGPILPTVMARCIKKDDDGYLREHRGFYARIAGDGATQHRVLDKLGRLNEIKRPAHAITSDLTTLYMLLAYTAKHDYQLIAFDAPNAYAQATRTRPPAFWRLPETIRDEFRTTDGREQVLVTGGPMQGEIPSGDEWHAEADSKMIEMGFDRAEGVPAMYTMNVEVQDKIQRVIMLKYADEFLLSLPRDHPVGTRVHEALVDAWGKKPELGEMNMTVEPTTWRGPQWFRDHAKGTLTVYMTNHIVKSARKHCPELLEGKAIPILEKISFKQIQAQFNELKLPPREEREAKLCPEQKKFQEIIGEMTFYMNAVPSIGFFHHRCTRIMSYPYPVHQALVCAMYALKTAFDDRHKGVTAGGLLEDQPRMQFDMHAQLNLDGAPPNNTEIYTDATFGQLGGDQFAYAVHYHGMLVDYRVKAFKEIIDSVHAAEGIGITTVAMNAENIAEITRALGEPIEDPILICTDSISNALASKGQAPSTRVKHMLRKWQNLQMRVKRALVRVLHVGDPSMPVDFLTKWVTLKKVNASVIYLTNFYNRVPHPDER